MKRLNLLFLGGAKRVSMARMFREAGRLVDCEVGIVSYELSPTVPIASEGPVVVGLRWNDPGLYDDLRRVCAECQIDIVVPFVDAAVGVAARLRDSAGVGIFTPVGDADVTDTMFDKVRSNEAFIAAGIPVPELWPACSDFPLIAKPRCGSASRGIEVIDSETALGRVASSGDYLIQRYIANREEYTVDCYVTLGGDIEIVSPRRRLEVVGGEVQSTVTVDDPEIVGMTRRALSALQLRGAVTVQFMRDLDTGRLLIMEVNPRLGGGAVCTVHAGANLPLAILCDALGRPLPDDARTPRPATLITRYPCEVPFYL